LKKPRQYRSRQGRSDKQYIASIKALAIAFAGLLGTLLLTSIF
tara:strand:- start:5450 stop:5578 length:129 start_codon:yes stop_codon:yes gene_type:complete